MRLIKLTILVYSVLCLGGIARGATDPNKLANAIYKAEGGDKTKFPYGIRSIDTKGNKEYARKICLNTINNHIKRHSKHKCGLDYITCLGNRFCPTTGKLSVAEKKVNGNWIRNVRHYYAK